MMTARYETDHTVNRVRNGAMRGLLIAMPASLVMWGIVAAIVL